MYPVTPNDVGVTLGVFSPTDEQVLQWTVWISDAERIIGAWARRAGYVYADLDQADLAYVIREAVALKVKRPDSATQVDVAVDDARVSRQYASGTGQVSILDEWWDLLSPASTGGSFTITPYAEPVPVAAWPYGPW